MVGARNSSKNDSTGKGGGKLIALIDSKLFTNLPRRDPDKLAVDFNLSDFINGHGDTCAERCSIPYPPRIHAFCVLCNNVLVCMLLEDVSLLAYGLQTMITI